MNISDILLELKGIADKKRAGDLQRLFKTWKWEYWYWDIFLWITVPNCRSIAKKYICNDINEIDQLLSSKYHEFRLTWIIILNELFKKWDIERKREIYEFYLSKLEFVNNWDLVDLSCHKIIGEYLYLTDYNDVDILYEFADSDNLWIRRIAIISTFAFVDRWVFIHSLNIAKALLADDHDLIHKAVWWVLREIWKKDVALEEEFLINFYDDLPRTTLRYAIERFPEERRLKFLKNQLSSL